MRWQDDEPEQVFNADHPTADLTPTGDADAVRAGWAPLLPGQAAPLLWERADMDGG